MAVILVKIYWFVIMSKGAQKILLFYLFLQRMYILSLYLGIAWIFKSRAWLQLSFEEAPLGLLGKKTTRIPDLDPELRLVVVSLITKVLVDGDGGSNRSRWVACRGGLHHRCPLVYVEGGVRKVVCQLLSAYVDGHLGNKRTHREPR